VFAGQEIEQQPVVCLAVDEVTLPLPADEPEVKPLYETNGRVTLHNPGIDRVKSEIPKRQGQHV
jgi:hypothetical protein